MSYAQFHPSELGQFGSTILNLLSMLRLVAMETNKQDMIHVNNFTLINFVLKINGPTHERTLTLYMLGIQVT